MNEQLLLDTDVVIDVLRDRDVELRRRWYDLVECADFLGYSAVTAAEVWRGARPQEMSAVKAMFSLLVCVPADAETGRRAGDYLRQFHPSHGIGFADAFVAASAAQHTLQLWTRNRKHYPMPDLRFF